MKEVGEEKERREMPYSISKLLHPSPSSHYPPFQCQACPAVLPSPALLETHMGLAHWASRPTPSLLCERLEGDHLGSEAAIHTGKQVSQAGSSGSPPLAAIQGSP